MLSFDDLFGSIAEGMSAAYDNVRKQTGNAGVGALIAPVDPFNRSRVLTPIVAAAGVVSMLLLAGVVVGSMATAVAALLALYYLLTVVFGYELSVAVPTSF